MSVPIRLNEVPQNFLDKGQWAKLRAFAPGDLIALTYINAPYPDRNHPRDFFWGSGGSFKQAVRCYEIGRNLLGQCRKLLIEGKVVATGSRPHCRRETIKPITWANLWPMFATNQATGPNDSFSDVEIVEAMALQTLDEKILLDCISWLRAQSSAAPKEKRTSAGKRNRALPAISLRRPCDLRALRRSLKSESGTRGYARDGAPGIRRDAQFSHQ
jgi:hypothetical protein